MVTLSKQKIRQVENLSWPAHRNTRVISQVFSYAKQFINSTIYPTIGISDVLSLAMAIILSV